MSGLDDELSLIQRCFQTGVSAHEQRLIRDLLARPTYKSVWTPEGLFKTWHWLVDQVESGAYDDMVDEYVNGLIQRDLLEDAVSLVAPARQGPIRELVEPLDFRFEAATRSVDAPLYVNTGRVPRWWFFRVPLRAGAYFRQHLDWWMKRPATEI
jgi:hypothetical protein